MLLVCRSNKDEHLLPQPQATSDCPVVCVYPTYTPVHVQSILQGVDAPLVPNTAVAKALGAASDAKTAAEQGPKTADTKSGRKLLQRSRSAGRNNNWSAQNTQSAIRAAAAGRTPVSYATAAGTRNARNANRGCVNCVNWQ
jgi:hypothetical protein